MPVTFAQTANGPIQGITASDPRVAVFRGIPYAQPPVGQLRWAAPKPTKPWSEPLLATTFGPGCTQPPATGRGASEVPRPDVTFSEDCLYLNVWTPASSQEEKLPVLVWIHGGANTRGYGHSATYDGEVMALEGIVVVTFNWRVGIFGWLSHPELSLETASGTSGNYAVLDQMAALKWVHDNIAAFGGDPNQVTIGGESAGASSVQLLCMTAMSEGLFQRAIMHSGGGFDLFSSNLLPELETAQHSVNLEALFGVNSIAAAREIPAEELLKRSEESTHGNFTPLAVIDNVIFTGSMSEMAKTGPVHDIDYLIGNTIDETGMYDFSGTTQSQFVREQQREYGDLAEEYLRLCSFLEDPNEFAEHLRVRSGELLRTGVLVWAETLERRGFKLPYVFQFERRLPGDDFGAYHAGDLWYLFGILGRNWRPFTGEDFELSRMMTKYWATFVRTGNPNTAGMPAWTPYSSSLPLTFSLNERPALYRIEDNPRIDFRRRFVLRDK